MSGNWIDGKVILVTGGTGSFGRKFTEIVLQRYQPRKLIIFSRDELKQYEMRKQFPEERFPAMRYFIGDVRDRERLDRAFDGVDVVIHAAALKQVPTAEYNPLEAIKTNILGAANIIDMAIDRHVSRVVALSTDKAVNPINLYGATKLAAEKLFVAGNSYVGAGPTRFAVVRYGNVMGSRGSVVPLFMELKKTGRLPVTDPRMTRFWITLEQGVELVLNSLEWMQGGEIFVPKIPSMRVADLAKAIAPECEIDVIGIRPGEKLHEVLVTEDEARNTVENESHYTILPEYSALNPASYRLAAEGRNCAEDFRYSSDNNPQWLSIEEMRSMLGL
jgi:UDP-N-acetylglucosamine 4,6-dehydratase